MTGITYLFGDATRPKAVGTRFIAHCCNNVGAWGAGFVMALSARWEQPELVFHHAHRVGLNSRLGDIQVAAPEKGIFVVNIIGQDGVGPKDGVPPVRYHALREGFHKLAILTADTFLPSIHLPRLGCGLAGGTWSSVEALIHDELARKDIPVFVYDLPAREE